MEHLLQLLQIHRILVIRHKLVFMFLSQDKPGRKDFKVSKVLRVLRVLKALKVLKVLKVLKDFKVFKVFKAQF